MIYIHHKQTARCRPRHSLRWLPLLSMLVAAATAADAQLVSPLCPKLTQIGAVSRNQDRLDIFTTDTFGATRSAAWEPDFTDWWHGWWQINSGQTAPGAPITAASRSTNKLDIFVVGFDNRVYTAAWEPDFTDGWHGWYPIGNLQVAPGARISAVSRSTNKLDIFVVGNDGQVWTAAWEPDFTDGWHGWWPISGVKAPPGAPVNAVSRSTDKLDLFVTDNAGIIRTAAWEPDFTDGWHGWSQINGGQAAPGAAVTAVSRGTDKLDVFVVGLGNYVYTAAWEPDWTDGWHGWWQIGNIQAPAGSFVNGVSRSTDKLDIFVTDTAGNIQTAAWEPDFTSWHGWLQIKGGQSAPGTPVSAVTRSTDKLDLFVVGLDGRVYTAAWEPDFTDGWHGWLPIGQFPQGPQVIGPLNATITIPGDIPVGGSAHLTLWPDGSYVFEGDLRDSGFFSYNDQVAFVVKDNLTNTAFVFPHSGHMNGTTESGSRDDSWNVTSRSADLERLWNNFAAGYSAYCGTGVNADFNSVLDKALSAVGTVTGVISIF